MKIAQCVQRAVGLGVEGKVGEGVLVGGKMGEELWVVFETAWEEMGREIEMVWKERGISLVGVGDGVR
ncbi:hypothetical protein, partial [Neisseria sicca]|uniref:hypothetical protein n=1 Tax=Neisseria sicca TaxID=490 RepID=UPI001C99A764